ncbi:glycosyltransferase, partial [Arthrospira platensis SPKY1]|nr:glycosyltransferase [Arthrospira platensis SPKY1]
MADFTIHPALYEPFGQIISESLACKTPVIISSMVGAREVVDPQSGIVIENFESGNWADILRDLKSSDFVIPDDIIQSKVLSLEQ